MWEELIAHIRSGFELGVRWTGEDGALRDPYETNRPENFAPACWSAIGAGLYRLTGEERCLEWTERWLGRTVEILEASRRSPGFQEYVLGYAAMVFPLLAGRVDDAWLEQWREAFAGVYTADAALSNSHVSAAQLVCDVYVTRGREERAQARAREILALFRGRLTPEGFLHDDDVRGASIPHAYLTASFIAAALLNPEPGPVEAEVGALLRTMGGWFRRANGAFALPVLANRSVHQLYVYPMAAQMAHLVEGDAAQERIAALLRFHRTFVSAEGVCSPTPSYLSPYALAGLEWTYNRLNTDVGAGMVAWTLLAALQQGGWQGLERSERHGPWEGEAPAEPLPGTTHTSGIPGTGSAGASPSPEQRRGELYDAAAGYAVLHGPNSRVALALEEHDWRYHLPLQPFALALGGEGIGPFVDPKRDGVKHPYLDQLQDPARVDPLLEPYFGLLVKQADGAYRVMSGRAERSGPGRFRLEEGGLALALAVEPGDGTLRLAYELEGVGAEDQVSLAVPVLLWDGREELRITVADGVLRLRWRGSAYRVETTAAAGAWELHMGRCWHAGYGLAANCFVRLQATSPRCATTLTLTREAG